MAAGHQEFILQPPGRIAGAAEPSLRADCADSVRSILLGKTGLCGPPPSLLSSLFLSREDGLSGEGDLSQPLHFRSLPNEGSSWPGSREETRRQVVEEVCPRTFAYLANCHLLRHPKKPERYSGNGCCSCLDTHSFKGCLLSTVCLVLCSFWVCELDR